MSSTTVECNKCGVVIDEPTDLPPEERKPCPNCGSTNRLVRAYVTAGIAIAGGIAPEDVIGQPAEPAPDPAHLSLRAATSAELIQAEFEAKLRWFRVGDFSMVHVLDADGHVIDAGLGDNDEDALLAVAERLLPPPAPVA